MIVCKFGGSCTTSEKALENIKKISKDKRRQIFVFSAIGKDECGEKLTDLLIKFCEEKNILKKREINKKIIKKLQKLSYFSRVNTEFSSIFNKNLISKSKNYIISRGEYFTSKIMADLLNVKFVPAEQLVIFENGNVSFEKTKQKAERYLKKYKRFCTGGFYGYDIKKKEIGLFERGGGDTTGAVLAKVCGADVYENYTDVCGVKEKDPKKYNEPKTIRKICYCEMKFLSSMGANVLHESVCDILKDTKIQTKVKSTLKPSGEFTIIDNLPHKTSWMIEKENKRYTKNKNIVKMERL